MNGVYKPTILLNSTAHEEPDTDSASLFAQGYDNSILSLAKNADILSEASRACCPIQNFNKALRPKSTGFCSCRIDPDFENFRNTVLRILANVQEDVQNYVQAGISLRKQEYVVLVEIRDRIDRCQRDIMLFIDTFSGEHMPQLHRQSSLLEARNVKLQMRAKNLLVNELDADKYLSTEPKRDKDLLKAENLTLNEEIKALKAKYELQLVRTQDLIDKLLDCIQADNTTKPRSVSYTRPGSASAKRPTRGEPRVAQAKTATLSSHTLQDVKKQLLELKNDTLDLQALVRGNKCGPICPHEQALHDLLKTAKQEKEAHLSVRTNNLDSAETGIGSSMVTVAQIMKKLFEASPGHPTVSNDNPLQIENSTLRQELASQRERIQTLERENVALLKELSNTKQHLDRAQKSALLLTDSSAKQQDGCQCGASTTALNASVLLQERNILCQKLQKKDLELTTLQAEIDEVMSELVSLHERYDELEKNAASEKVTRDANSTQHPCEPPKQTIYKDVVTSNEGKAISENVVDFSTLYSNHKNTNTMPIANSQGTTRKSNKINRPKSKARPTN